MNAHINTAATPEIGVPPQNLILVPLSQLRPSRLNVRKTVGASITELADSVARVGLLQNLTVILARDGEHYEVVAAVRQFAPAHITRLSKLKKADLASEAERLAVGTGWMPAIFDTALASDSGKVEVVESSENEMPKYADDKREEAHALTA